MTFPMSARRGPINQGSDRAATLLLGGLDDEYAFDRMSHDTEEVSSKTTNRHERGVPNPTHIKAFWPIVVIFLIILRSLVYFGDVTFRTMEHAQDC